MTANGVNEMAVECNKKLAARDAEIASLRADARRMKAALEAAYDHIFHSQYDEGEFPDPSDTAILAQISAAWLDDGEDAAASSQEYIPREAIRRHAALEELACLLFWELEQLDPTGHFEMSQSKEENWMTMSESERAFYVSALQRTLLNRELVRQVLGER